MVIDEEITFTREESAHTGTVTAAWEGHTENGQTSRSFPCFFFFVVVHFFTEDCTDCFGTQKKDEPNDKEKKEDEDLLTPVHHSIIETWDWGRQPGGRGLPEKCLGRIRRRIGVILHRSVPAWEKKIPPCWHQRVSQGRKCRLDAMTPTVSTHGRRCPLARLADARKRPCRSGRSFHFLFIRWMNGGLWLWRLPSSVTVFTGWTGRGRPFGVYR